MGSSTVNVVPTPGALRKVMLPPWSSMILWVRASPSPVPLRLGGEERVEHPVGLRRRDPAARVLDLDAHPAAAPRPAGPARRRARAQPTRSVSRPPVGMASSALRDEVDERLVEARRVGPDRGQVARVLARHRDAAWLSISSAYSSSTRSSSVGTGAAAAKLSRLGPGQLEQPLDDAVDPLQLARHHRTGTLARKLLVVELARA